MEGWRETGGVFRSTLFRECNHPTAKPVEARRLDTFVSGVDANNLDGAAGEANQLDPAALSALGRFNTRDYHGPSKPGRMKQYRALASAQRSSHALLYVEVIVRSGECDIA